MNEKLAIMQINMDVSIFEKYLMPLIFWAAFVVMCITVFADDNENRL